MPDAPIAQLVEHFTRNEGVIGSSPTWSFRYVSIYIFHFHHVINMEVFMTYQKFEETIVDSINDRLPKGHSLTLKPVNKNNGVVLHGLVINNGHCNISPTIYLDYYYDEYKKGQSVDFLASQIISQYQRFALEDDFDISFFTDYEKCKKNISYKLINYEKNKELLKDVPHIVYLDLAIVFYCLISNIDSRLKAINESDTSSILIRNSHMEHWGVTVNDLFEVASVNTPKLLKSEIRNLADIVKELMEESALSPQLEEDENLLEDSRQYPMYVLTNKIKLFGACCILYKNLLGEFANKLESDLYIIPSSIHEVLLVPKTIECDSEYLTDLIRQVNSTELDTQEVLSDHVYYYSRVDDAITY